MLKSTFRGMIAHKLRLVLTTASIALGIAFLAGTLILTDTMGLAFNQLFGKVSAGTDAVVRTEASFTESTGVGTSRAPIEASVLDDVAAVDGVRVAEGFTSGYALLTDNDGKAILTSGGAPTMGYTMAADEELRGEVESSPDGAAGRRRGGDRRHQCRGERRRAGSTIKVLFQGPTQEFTVVGTVGFGGEKNLGGTTSAYFDAATAQQVLGDRFRSTPSASQRRTALAEGADRAPRRRRSRGHRGGHRRRGLEGERRRSQRGAEDGGDPVHDLRRHRALRRRLHHLEHVHDDRHAAVREIALMRAVGATRRQVLRGLLLEAFIARLRRLGARHRPRLGVAKGLSSS